MLFGSAARPWAEEPKSAVPADTKPPWQRSLQGDAAKKAEKLLAQVNELDAAGNYAAAVAAAKELLALREKVQGKDHWQASDERWQVKRLERLAGGTEPERTDFRRSQKDEQKAEALEAKFRHAHAQPLREEIVTRLRKLLGEEHPDTADSYHNLAYNLDAQGKYPEAEKGYRKALDIRRQVLGEDHPDTASSYNNLAANLHSQGKYAEADQGHRKALAIRLKVLGKENLDTAQSYHNLAANQDAQGKHAEAEQGFRKALDIKRKILGEEHPDTATTYNNLAGNQHAQGKFADAEQAFGKVLAIRRKIKGDGHPDTATSFANLAYNLSDQGKYAEAEQGYRKALDIFRKIWGEEHPASATCYNGLAFSQNGQGKLAEAEQNYRKALAIRRKVLGEEHPAIATCYHNLAGNMKDQGKYAEAEEGFLKALNIRRKALGEEHPDTAIVHNSLANIRKAQGKYAEAEQGYRRALDIQRKILGEEHPDTAKSYLGLSSNQDAQGKYAEAEQGYRKALDILGKTLGGEHPDTARTYNHLAGNLNAQGKYSEAEQGYRKALDIQRKVLGEEHPDTATCYHNLAHNQNSQGKLALAEQGYRKALDIWRKALGEDHPDTAAGYKGLAVNQKAQGKYAEAEPGFRKALQIWAKALGEEHPLTAQCHYYLASNQHDQGKYGAAEEGFRKSLEIFGKALGGNHPYTAHTYHDLALNQNSQGKYVEAEKGFRKALEIYGKGLGEEHPDTATIYLNLGSNLLAQRRDQEAEVELTHAADSFSHARSRLATSGIDRIPTSGAQSSLPILAVLLARRDQPDQAWQRFEQGLGRATWDELGARLARTPADQNRLAGLTQALERLDLLLERYAILKEPTGEQTRQHREHLGQHRQTQEKLDKLTGTLAHAHGLVWQSATLLQVQAALPAETALLGWLDLQWKGKTRDLIKEHWAVLVRAKGAPVWVRLPGSGPNATWTEADDRLPAELLTALANPARQEATSWRPLAQRLFRQRMQPLVERFAATTDLPEVRHLVVLPSDMMDGIPPEVLSARYTFSRVPSATVFAFLRGKAKPRTDGLLALADPIFDRPHLGKSALLPPGGLLITAVVPGSKAARAGLRAGDVLLSYGGKPIKTPADLQALIQAPPADPQAGIAVEVWRNGAAPRVEVSPGPLEVTVAKGAAPEVLAARRRIDAELAAHRGEDVWKELPGTRIEAQSLIRRFQTARQPSTLLVDSQASEQRLAELVQDGTLAKTRYLHLATHGTIDPRFALQSAVILSRDKLPDPTQQLNAGLPVYDGRLTAAEVLRDWDLDADLVTLSACQTGLGRHASGEGYLGFAQALLVAGSRSVCLSLWHVDDAATALLMDRFYANLLGQRHGLNAPLGKADALAEAKLWLRTLPRKETLKLAAQLTGGVERGKGRPALPLAPMVPETAKEDEPPYAHPYYWAGFVLVGARDLESVP